MINRLVKSRLAAQPPARGPARVTYFAGAQTRADNSDRAAQRTATGVGLQDVVDPGPLQIATGAFYDGNLNPRTRHRSLYLGLGGAGVHQIDGPLETIGAVSYSIGCSTCASVYVADDTHRLLLALQRGGDGAFHGTQLLDLASGGSTLRFHLIVNGNNGPVRSLSLKRAARTGGVTAIRETCELNANNRGDSFRCRRTASHDDGDDNDDEDDDDHYSR